jgi:2'-5' RNA ligase/SAM-dependent methyltransferase
MYWAEITDYTGWMVKLEHSGTSLAPWDTMYGIVTYQYPESDSIYLFDGWFYYHEEDVLERYDPTRTGNMRIWKGLVKNVHPLYKIDLNVNKQANEFTYTDASDVNQSVFSPGKEEFHTEIFPFLKDEFIGEDEVPIKFILDPNSKGYTKIDEPQGTAYNGIRASLDKLSWQVETNEFYELERLLNNKHYSYHLEGNTFIIDHGGNVNLDSLTSLPDNIQFNNRGYVYLDSLTSLPNNIQFNNRGYVNLYSLTSLPNNVQFNNRGNVDLNSLTSLPDNIQFNNRGNVYLYSLTSLPNNVQFNNRGYVYLVSLKSLPNNKYDIFKNDGVISYNRHNSQFNPKDREKLSWQEIDNYAGWLVKLKNKRNTNDKGRVFLVLSDVWKEKDEVITGWRAHVFTKEYDREVTEKEQEQDVINQLKNGDSIARLTGQFYDKIPIRKVLDLDKIASKKSLFIYIKPDEKLPKALQNEKALHITLVYLSNTVDDKREECLKDLQKVLKKYKKPECNFTGKANFNNTDNSNVLLINFENGAELYSDIIKVLSKYVEIDRDYNFISHMTIENDIDMKNVEDYKWKPDKIHVEFEKDVPAVTIEFETGELGEEENLDKTSTLNSLSWQENNLNTVLLKATIDDIWKVTNPDNSYYISMEYTDLQEDNSVGGAGKWTRTLPELFFEIKKYKEGETWNTGFKVPENWKVKYVGRLEDLEKEYQDVKKNQSTETQKEANFTYNQKVSESNEKIKLAWKDTDIEIFAPNTIWAEEVQRYGENVLRYWYVKEKLGYGVIFGMDDYDLDILKRKVIGESHNDGHFNFYNSMGDPNEYKFVQKWDPLQVKLGSREKLSWQEISEDLIGWVVEVHGGYRVILDSIDRDWYTVTAKFSTEQEAKERYSEGSFSTFMLNKSQKFQPLYKVDLTKQASNETNFTEYKDRNRKMYEERSKYYDDKDGGKIFWSSTQAQQSRFETLIGIGDLTDKKILDVGCGHADLLDYIEKKGIKIQEYVGIDIVKDIVEKARELHPNMNIEIRDIQKDPIKDESFDYVFGSGIFALNTEQWNQYVIDMLQKLLETTRIGVAVNFLKASQFNQSSQLKYNNAQDVLNLIKQNVTDKVILKENYLNDDFTLYIFKNQNKLSWQVETNEFYELERLLNNKHYSYHLEGNTFIIDHEGNVDLYSLTSLPNNIQFNNRGFVNLASLLSLPDNIQFNNEGNVYLNSLTSLPNNIQFNNRGNVYLYSLTSLSDNIQFNNEGFVNLDSLTSLPDNKYDIFKNDRVVFYNHHNSQFNPKDREKLSWNLNLENASYETILRAPKYSVWKSIDSNNFSIYFVLLKEGGVEDADGRIDLYGFWKEKFDYVLSTAKYIISIRNVDSTGYPFYIDKHCKFTYLGQLEDLIKEYQDETEEDQDTEEGSIKMAKKIKTKKQKKVLIKHIVLKFPKTMKKLS